MKAIVSLILVLVIYNGFTQTGNLTLVPQTAPTAEVSCTKVSPDGKLLAVGDETGTIKIFNLKTLMEINSVVAHASSVKSLVFSPESDLVASVSRDLDCQIWETATGRIVESPFAGEFCHSIQFVDQNNYLVMVGEILYSVNRDSGKKGKLLKVEKSKTGRFKAIISDDGELVIVTNHHDVTKENRTQSISVFSISKEKQLARIEHKYDANAHFPDDIHAARINKNKDAVYIGHEYGFAKINLQETQSNKTVLNIPENISCLNVQVSFSGNGQGVAYPCSDYFYFGNLQIAEKVQKFQQKDWNFETYLALYPDNTRVVVLDRKFTQFKIMDVSSGKVIEEKRIQGDRVLTAKYNSLSRTIAIAGSVGNSMGLWSLDDLKLIAVSDSFANSKAQQIATSPMQQILVSVAQGKKTGLPDENKLIVSNSLTGKKLYNIPDPDARSIMSMNFAPDGTNVLLGYVGNGIKMLNVNQKTLSTIPIANWVNSIHGFSDNDRVLVGENVAVWSRKSLTKLYDFDINAADMDYFDRLDLSPDEKLVAMTYTGKKPETRYVAIFDASNGKFLRRMVNHKNEKWVMGRKVTNLNFPVKFNSKSTLLVTGSNDNRIRIFDAQSGNLKKTLEGHTGSITTVAFIDDDKFILSGSMDGSVRLWNLETGEWTAISSSPDFTKWVVYNSQGYFDASNDGGDLVAMTDGTECWNIDQFAVWKNRPDLILKGVKSKNTGLIAHYSKLYQKRLRKFGLTDVSKSRLMDIPFAEITKQNIQGKTTELEFTLCDKTGGLMSYNIFVNNVPLFGSKGKVIGGNSFSGKELVELTQGRNKIEISCTNADQNESYRAVVYADYTQKVTGDLYFLAFGISEYKNPIYNLQFAHKDALDLEKTMKGLKGYNRIYTKVYTNKNVTTENIANAKEFLANAKIDDTFVLFIAGHGMYDRKGEPEYYYLTYHADTTNLAQTATRFELIEDLLQGIPPRNKIFLMDACESGEIDEEEYKTLAGIENLSLQETSFRGFKSTNTSASLSAQGGSLSGAETNRSETNRAQIYERNRYIFNDLSRRSGAVVFSSSRGSEASQERKDLKQGLFTHFILKALTTTEADTDKNEAVSTDELRTYVSSEVAKASGDLQNPTVDRDNIYQKFGFGVK